jgi:tRNA pseudouridine38-40 synthase
VTEPADPDPGDGGLVRVRIDLAYDGTGFAGWAIQPRQRTVQAELEGALATVLRLPDVRVTCAGRTDAGVHARGQVVHADVPLVAFEGNPYALGRRLAGVLPPDMGVRAVAIAPPGFDARFSPLWRRYAYRLTEHPFGPEPLHRRDVVAHGRPLDVAAMQESSGPLVGEHDFAAFCRRREGATTVRTLLELQWSRAPHDLVVATVLADAFCHSMVRSLVGACLAVGEGRRTAAWPAQVLAGRVRRADVTVAPALGLTLEEVHYPPDDEVAARALAARRRREAPA